MRIDLEVATEIECTVVINESVREGRIIESTQVRKGLSKSAYFAEEGSNFGEFCACLLARKRSLMYLSVFKFKKYFAILEFL